MLKFIRKLRGLHSARISQVAQETEEEMCVRAHRTGPEVQSSTRQLTDDDNLPLSIMPEPDLYIEPPAAPFERLRTLVDVSDGGVLAVTGERGAGKSILLRKVAEYYSTNPDAAQNVVIHLASPVGSARDMDVFVMLFRQLTVTVKNLLLEKGRRAGNDIEAIGREAMRNLRQLNYLAMGFLVLLFMAVSIWFLLPILQRNRISDLESSLEAAQARRVEDDPRLAVALAQLKNAEDAVTLAGKATTQKQMQRAVAAKKIAENIRETAKEARADRITILKLSLQEAKKETTKLNEVAVMAITASTAYFMLIPVWASYRRRRMLGLTVLEQGLLIYSERIERRLDFETTKGEERSFELNPVGWVKAGGKRSSSDKARGLSLPELTASYIEYVKQIRRVFPGKIVVCIDELDKITDLEQVRFILREIKGALYVKGSYYILSISTDGLRSFEGRLADGRDIFESTFDDALTIRGLDIASCRAILQSRLDKLFSHGDDDETKRIITVISVLSGGNARELMRTFREWILLERQVGRPVSAGEIWEMFLSRRIQAMIDRLSVPGASSTAADFTVLLEAIRRNPTELIEHLKRLSLLGNAVPVIAPAANQISNDDTAQRLSRYAVELRILLTTNLKLIESGSQVSSTAFTARAERLLAAYQKVPVSIRGAAEELDNIRDGETEFQRDNALKMAENRLREAFSSSS